MKLFKRSFLFIALIIVFYFMIINISHTVDVKYFFGEEGLIKNVSLIVIIFISVIAGFFIGILFLLTDFLELKKQLKKQKVELEVLKEEVDSHRNIVVKDVLKTEPEKSEISEDNSLE